MKPYLFTYGQACTQAQVHDVLNDTEGVQTWVAPFPYSAILISMLNVHDLSAILRNRLPDVWFMVTEVDHQAVNGWLPGDFWEYVNAPQKVGSQQLFRAIASPEHLRQPVAEADRMTGT